MSLFAGSTNAGGQLEVIEQSSQPVLGIGDTAIWRDTLNNVTWLIVNVGGTQYLVEATN